MGRVVDYKTQKLSEKDRQYLLSRGERGAVAANDRMFGDGASDDVFVTHSAHELTPETYVPEPQNAEGVPAGQQVAAPDNQGTTREQEIREKANKLTVEKLREELDERSIDYDSDDRKAELVEKLTQAVLQQEQAGA